MDLIVSEGAAMIPELESTRYIRAYCGIRPLIEAHESVDDRSVSRGFALLDHTGEGVENFITITGGKLTTFRLMAEKAANLICARLGVPHSTPTRVEPLPRSPDGRWTEPGLTPRLWLEKGDPQDVLLCECEMVPTSVVDAVVESIRNQNGKPSLKGISLRSRLGKGPCQGAFCSIRILAHLYDRGVFSQNQGVEDLKKFLAARWRGQKPLMWGSPLMQAELQEAMHCGLLGLELDP